MAGESWKVRGELTLVLGNHYHFHNHNHNLPNTTCAAPLHLPPLLGAHHSTPHRGRMRQLPVQFQTLATLPSASNCPTSTPPNELRFVLAVYSYLSSAQGPG